MDVYCFSSEVLPKALRLFSIAASNFFSSFLHQLTLCKVSLSWKTSLSWFSRILEPRTYPLLLNPWDLFNFLLFQDEEHLRNEFCCSFFAFTLDIFQTDRRVSVISQEWCGFALLFCCCCLQLIGQSLSSYWSAFMWAQCLWTLSPEHLEQWLRFRQCSINTYWMDK